MGSRGFAGLVLTVLLVAACGAQNSGQPATPRPPATCEVDRLPLPEGMAGATVGAASPDGRTIAGFALPQFSKQGGIGVLWRDGEIVATPAFPGPVAGMNNRGEVAGNAGDSSAPYAWIYTNGQVRELDGGTVIAIGQDGTLVGARLMPTPNGPPVYVPARWRPGSTTPEDLPMPSKETGQAGDVTDDGTIVGAVGADPYVWYPDGRAERLKRPAEAGRLERVGLYRANGHWAVGNDGHGGVARWYLGDGAADREPQSVAGVRPSIGTYGDGVDINASGVVVVGEGYGAKVEGGGQVVTLPSPGPGYMTHPTTISADATVITGTTNENPRASAPDTPVHWTCKP